MCLLIAKNESIKTANEDILVYKWVEKRWNCWFPPIRRHPGFKYNTVLTALDIDGNPIEHLIPSPRHTYICVGFNCNTIKLYRTNVVCIIPKGAEYCYGTEYEIISTKLIVFRHIWNYWWYKLRHK